MTASRTPSPLPGRETSTGGSTPTSDASSQRRDSSPRAALRGLDYDAQVQLLAADEPAPKGQAGPVVQKRDYQTDATTSGEKLTVKMDDLEAEISNQLQGADSLDAIVLALNQLGVPAALAQAVKGQKAFAEKPLGEIENAVSGECQSLLDLAQAVGAFKSIVAPLGRSAVHEIAAFRKAWGDAQANLGKGMPVKVFVNVVKKQLKSVQDELAQKPDAQVQGGTTAKGQAAKDPKKDEAMSELEKRFDVLARKSAPPPDDKNNISEVDLAFMAPMRGFPDVFASLASQTKKVDLSKANEEKVFSVGSGGALGFKGELSDKPGARFYGVLLPKGWIAKYGEELRDRVTKSDNSGKRSARAPNGVEMGQKTFVDEGQKVDIGQDKAFGIRAEESTKDQGQVDVHRDRMVTLGGQNAKMSHIEFFRQSSVGVVEFSDKGLGMHLRRW
ncbi:MAG: hypothetical protein U1F43_07430 [Myxococcota bacterium]